MPTPEQVKGVAEAYITASKRNDKAPVLAQFAPDTVWYDPVGQPPHVGVEGVGAFYDQTRQLADRVEMKLLDLIVCGSEAAMILEIHATVGDSVMIIDCAQTLDVHASCNIG